MRFASPSTFSPALLTALFVGACASSSDVPPQSGGGGDDASGVVGDDGGSSWAYDSPYMVPGDDSSSPPVTDTGTGPTCSVSCHSATDCQSGCPALPSGIYCCDTPSSTCYAAASQCPPPPPQDSGGDAPPY